MQLQNFVCANATAIPEKINGKPSMIKSYFHNGKLIVCFDYQNFGTFNYEDFDVCNKHVEDMLTLLQINVITSFDIPSGEYYEDYCDEEGMYGAFYTADDTYGRSGHCYYLGEKEQVEEYVANKNRDIYSIPSQVDFDIRGYLCANCK
jgi:hypothetical protein